jgi:hypothetical protein
MGGATVSTIAARILGSLLAVSGFVFWLWVAEWDGWVTLWLLVGLVAPLVLLQLIGRLAKRWHLLLLAILLTGCIAKNPAQWAYAPDQETAIKAAINECEAYTSNLMFRAAEFGGAIVPLVALARGPAAFNQCMTAKGYRGQP